MMFQWTRTWGKACKQGEEGWGDPHQIMQPEGCDLLAHLQLMVEDVSRVRDSPHYPGPHSKFQHQT